MTPQSAVAHLPSVKGHKLGPDGRQRANELAEYGYDTEELAWMVAVREDQLAQASRTLQSPVGELPPLPDVRGYHRFPIPGKVFISREEPYVLKSESDAYIAALTAQLAAAQAELSREIEASGAVIEKWMVRAELAESKLTTQREDTIRECADNISD